MSTGQITLHSLMPSVDLIVDLIFPRFGFKLGIQLPLLLDRLNARPVSHGKTREISGTESRCLGDARTKHIGSENIALELHQQIVARGTAVYLEIADRQV